jgi:ankyrin repeat protein
MALRANKPDKDADTRCGAGLRPCGRAFARPGASRTPGERVFRGAAGSISQQSGHAATSRVLLLIVTLLTALNAGESDTRLIDAVKSGNREAVQALLKNRALINTPEPDGTTPLQWAVRADDLSIVQSLLSAGANAKASNRYGVTPLELAAVNGDATITQALLKAGADPAAPKPEGQTILMTAARIGNPDVVRALLDHGGPEHSIDVNARESSYGETALMWAASENHPAAAKLLIEHGADVNARSTKMEYQKDRFGLEGVITVLPHGSWTPLMYAARQGSLGAARVLADNGASLNLTDPDGTTALVLAIINGHFDTAALLLLKGADPNLADSTGMAPLFAAVDMNTLGEIYGRPAQHPASGDTSALDLIKLLLGHGAKPNAQLRTPALYRAHTPGEPNLGDGATPLMRAAKNGDAAAMRLLLENGADPTLTERNHTTALMLAAGLGRGLGVFAGDYATEAQMVEGLKVLLDRHVDVNAVNDAGQSALHFAALSSDTTIKLLVEHGAKLDIKDKQGRTPLDFAMGGGGRGRAGGPPVVRPETAALLRQLTEAK